MPTCEGPRSERTLRGMLDLPNPALVGVIHLPGLPGSPCHQLSMDEIIGRALADGRTLQQAGFDAAVVENFGDVPFTADALPPPSLAAMAVVADQVRRETDLRIGINALRNARTSIRRLLAEEVVLDHHLGTGASR